MSQSRNENVIYIYIYIYIYQNYQNVATLGNLSAY